MLEDTPLFRAELRVPGGFRSVSVVGGATFQTEGDTVRALVEDVHAVGSVGMFIQVFGIVFGVQQGGADDQAGEGGGQADWEEGT